MNGFKIDGYVQYTKASDIWTVVQHRWLCAVYKGFRYMNGFKIDGYEQYTKASDYMNGGST